MTATVTEGNVTHLSDPKSDDVVILHALKILESCCRTPGWYVQNADEVKNYLRLLASGVTAQSRYTDPATE